MEYPGYGLYKAPISAEDLLLDACHLFDHITQVLNFDPRNIIIFGRSIGSSPSCFLAKNRTPAALILLSPFKSIKEVARDLVGRVLAGLVAERYRNIELLRDVICPVFIVHG